MSKGQDNRILIRRLEPSIDGEIARDFYERGKKIHEIVMTQGDYSKKGLSEEKYLVAQKDCWVPDEHRGTFYNCVTACTKVVLLNKFRSASLDSSEVLRMADLAVIDGVTIRNALADSHGIPPTTDLYYIYNVSMADMCKVAYAKTFALLLWREMNKEAIFAASGDQVMPPLDHEWEMAIAYRNIDYMARKLARFTTIRDFIEPRLEQLKPTLRYLDGLDITRTKHSERLEETLERFYAMNPDMEFRKLRRLKGKTSYF